MTLCPRCSTPLSEHTAGGLCAACMLTEAFRLPPAMDAIDLFADMPEGEENFGRFFLLEEIGRGGMGVVYRAREKISGRIVALKMILPGYLRAPEVLRQFKTEIQAVGRLEHPNILSVYEIGEHDGLPFFSMRFAEGGNLARRIKDFVDRPREVVTVMHKIALAMAHAHQRGVVHRDLKPGNILLDGEGEPLVGDFGIAKVLSSELDSGQTMMALGTPNYAAPELLLEGNAAVTTGVDIYGIGAIAYELLTGAPPYSGPTAGAILQQINESPLISVRARSGAIDKELEAVILKCLARNPADRYESALALAQDLDRWRNGFPVIARPVGALGQLWRWAKRKPAIAALSAALAVFVVAGGIGSAIAAVRIARERDRAVQAEARAQEELYRSLLSQARASRHTGLAGQRFDGLAAIRKAAAIHANLETRNEAAALLALADLRLDQERQVARVSGKQMLIFNQSFDRYALVEGKGDISVRRANDDREIIHLENPGTAALFFLSSFSPDGNFIVGYYGDALRTWDVSSGKVVIEIKRPLMTNAVGAFWNGFGFRADSRAVVLSSPLGDYSVYSLPDGKELARFPGKPLARMIRFDPKGERLAQTDYDKFVRLLEPATGGQILRTFEHPVNTEMLAWSPDGQILAVGTVDYQIYLWDVATGKRLRVLNGHRGIVTQLLFSHDGRFMASNSIDGSVRLWLVATGELLVTLPNYGTEPTMQFSADDKQLTMTQAGRFLSFEVATGLAECDVLPSPTEKDYVTSSISSSDFSPDGKWLAVATRAGIHVWDLHARRVIARLPLDPKEPSGKSVRFIEHGGALLVSSRQSGLSRMAFSPAASEIFGPRESIFGEGEFDLNDVSADGSVAGLSSRFKNEIAFLSLARPKEIIRIPGQLGIWNLALSKDGRWGASNSKGQPELPTSNIRLWDATTGRESKALGRGARAQINFSPDGRWLFAAGEKAFEAFQVGSWESGPPLPEALREAAMFGASGDGKQVGVLLDDRTWILSGDNFTPQVTLESPHETPHDARVIFNADGSLLAQHYSDGTMLLWNLRLVREELKELGLAGEK